MDGLFNQWDNREIAKDGLIVEAKAGATKVKMPPLPGFIFRDTKRADYGARDARTGFSMDVWLQLDSLKGGQVLLDSRDANGKGIALTVAEKGALHFTINDGRQEAAWDSDQGKLATGKPQHVVVTVDGGPKIITFIVNGILCDGGEERQFGWGRYSPTLRTPNGAPEMRVADSVKSLRIYSRALRTSEAVGNFNAGPM